MPITCAPRLEIVALGGIPVLRAGDDLARVVLDGLSGDGLTLRDGDVIVVASKAVSRVEGRFVDLGTVEASSRAREVARETGQDERLVELILRESSAISRQARGALVVRHKLGFVSADAGIDMSNARPSRSAGPEPDGLEGPQGPWVLLLPEAPDRSAENLRAALTRATGAHVGVVVSDSFGRPFRLGTVGAAIGVAGLPAIWDKRGEPDLFERRLEHTLTAVADQVAAAADLVAGQGAEGRAVMLVRGLTFEVAEHGAHELVRPPEKDLYA
jgi:coenzyme F420-0:L-glutamate ligase/coenzyme F420-1:gamma-L-glutamate ligase